MVNLNVFLLYANYSPDIYVKFKFCFFYAEVLFLVKLGVFIFLLILERKLLILLIVLCFSFSRFTTNSDQIFETCIGKWGWCKIIVNCFNTSPSFLEPFSCWNHKWSAFATCIEPYTLDILAVLSDQALYCWLINFKLVVILISLKWSWTVPKMEVGLFHLRNWFSRLRVDIKVIVSPILKLLYFLDEFHMVVIFLIVTMHEVRITCFNFGWFWISHKIIFWIL